MQLLGYLRLLLCSVVGFYKKIFDCFFSFVLMDCFTCLKDLNLKADFGCGFLVFGSFRQVFKIWGLFFLFGIGLRFLQICWYCKGFSSFLCEIRGIIDGFRKGLCSKSDNDAKYSSKIRSSKSKKLRFLKNLSTPIIDTMKKTQDNAIINKAKIELDAEFNNRNAEKGEEQECYDEDEVFDVLTLRKMIKIERRRADNARSELEKERTAAATAAEEAMALILRLQNGKSMVEMEANQYRRLAEEKQLHDQEVIQCLQWLLLKHESERSHLEDQLRLWRDKLKLSMQSEEGEHFEGVEESCSLSNINFEEALNCGLFSSLDMNASP